MRNISHLFAAGNFPSFERDPEITNIENNVLQRMADITAELAQKYGQSNIQNEPIKFVSVEDAIKELTEMKKNKLF